MAAIRGYCCNRGLFSIGICLGRWSIWTSHHKQNFLGDSLNNFDPGYRRAHGKGICFDGTYHSNGAAAALSKATVFAKSDIPAIGRFSIGSGNPHAADNSTATVSMALLLSAADHSQWRMKLNNFPYFPTRNAEGFWRSKKHLNQFHLLANPIQPLLRLS